MTGQHAPLAAAFLDKDGTLIHDVPYNVDPNRIELMPGAAEGASRLVEAGYAIIVVSNQSGVSRGLFAEAAIADVERRIRELLAGYGVPLAGFYYCTHHPQGRVARYSIPCNCRKPKPGMILRAARELSLDLSRSWLIGDILDDVEAGHRAGCQTVFLDNGHETLWQWNSVRRPDVIVDDLSAAAKVIVTEPADVVIAREFIP